MLVGGFHLYKIETRKTMLGKVTGFNYQSFVSLFK
jgi:hypothetical protein